MDVFMNFDEAIKAHASWKMKLNHYLNHPDGSLKPEEIEKDNRCVLGEWLYSAEGKKYSHLNEYKELVKEHAVFHQSAADIVRRKNNGQDVHADVVLGSNAPFSKHSMNVVSLIMTMKNIVK